MIFLGIIVGFIVFSLIILIHEYGHYKSARIFAVRVEEFGLGIPPRAKKLWKNKNGTLFSLNWIPLGGFVKIAGESPLINDYYDKNGKLLNEEEIIKTLKNKEDLYNKELEKISLQEKKYLEKFLKKTPKNERFYTKTLFQKTLILLAGVIMNMILAVILLSFAFYVGTGPLGVNTVIKAEHKSLLLPTFEEAQDSGFLYEDDGFILTPIGGGSAQSGGIQAGDTLTLIDGITFIESEEVVSYIVKNPNIPLSFNLERNTLEGGLENIVAQITPNSEGKIGAYIGKNISVNPKFQYNFGLSASIVMGVKETYIQTRLTLSGLKMLGQKIFFPKQEGERQEAVSQVSGPIGIFSIIIASLSAGFVPLILLTALISINIGVFNLLPIPALDGGRILLLWIRTFLERLGFSKNNGHFIESMTHFIFFILLIALSIIIAYNDIIKIFS